MSVRQKNGPAALQMWAKQATDGYRGVNVTNMTTSWRNGLAFCALIHRYYPELIDYDSLDGADVFGNCTLAFEVAESKLGIPVLLDPQDMLAYEVPDKLSILTYVAQFHNVFKHVQKRSTVRPSQDENTSPPNSLDGCVNKTETGSKRPAVSSDEILEATRDNGPKRPVLLRSQATCSVCCNPVFISERVYFAKQLYHRSCFRCSNCDCVLNPNTVDVSLDGKVFCLEKDCHRKLLQVQHEEMTDGPPNLPKVEVQSKDDGDGAELPRVVEAVIKEASDPVAPATSETVSAEAVVVGEPSDVISVVGEDQLEDQQEKNEDIPDDKLNVEVVENPTIDSEKRSVSFSTIVEVAKIESDSSAEIIEAPVSDAPTKEEHKEEEEVVETSSPKVKHKNVFEFLRDNLETMGASGAESGLPNRGDKEISEGDGGPHEECHKNVSDNPFEVPDEPEDDTQDYVSHNESGVGDSLKSESKSEIHSADSSECEPKEKVPSECGEAVPETEPSADTDFAENIETKTSPKPSVKPRRGRSKSPTASERSPMPTPRKRASAPPSTNELWKTKDYYPTELNPFESEDSFAIQPSDILLVKKASSKERIAPLNPFEEDDEDEEQNATQNVYITPPPKSPVNSIRSTGSGTGSVSGRPRKSRRAPLPPTMLSPQSRNSSPISPAKEKRPAPPPPRSRASLPITSTPTPPERKVIPAPPNLLKGLKEKTNNATAQQYRKKRRAPPPKRHVAPLPEATIKTEIADLNVKEKELERQGITLEANIRKLMDQEDENLTEQIDEMVVQLWNVVNEKNDIVRRQTELDYLRRGHRLEQTQADVEFQLRMLMETPAEQRQENQEEVEQQLLDQLLKIVDERNEVVDWLDFHRQLDREEDMHVSQSLSSFSSMNSRSSTPTPSNQVVLPMASENLHEQNDKTVNGSLNGHTNKSSSKEKSSKKEKFKIVTGLFTLKKKKKDKSKKTDDEKDKDESLPVP